MRRRFAIAVLAAATAICPHLDAQVRGGSRIMARPVFRPAVSGMRTHTVRTWAPATVPRVITPGRVVVNPSRFGHSGVVPINRRFRHHHHFFFSSCFGPFFNPFLCQQAFFAPPLIWPSPIFWPDVSQTYQAPQQAAEVQYQPDAELRADIDRLTQEVEMLRQEQQLRNQPPQAPSTAPERPSSTVLVFRDGHRTEVNNYGIAGQTLWIFTERRARKVPLADLDLKATQQVNAERGVEFLAPTR